MSPKPPAQPEIDSALHTLYAAGLPIRASVTGPSHVARSNTNASAFSQPMQALATQVGWGAIWSRPGLARQQRSLLNVAMLTALGKSQELGVHVKGAVRNGCSVVEVREAVLQAGVYAGLPAGLEGFRVAEGALGELMGREEVERAVVVKAKFNTENSPNDPIMAAKLAPLSTLKVLTHQIPAHGLTPNTSLQNKPLLIYRSAFPPETKTSALEAHLNHIGVVTPQWRYTMYSQSHFHSTTHEVLCISSGSARLCFGHEDNPGRVVEEVRKGDVVVVPAGVAHRLVRDLDGGFEMVGAYPVGKAWDMCYGREGEEGKVEGIRGLGWFERDPVFGDQGPVLNV